MPKFQVKGVYEMRFFIEINREVAAESTDEALEIVEDEVSIADAYDQEAHWSVCHPPKVTVRKL